MIKRLLSCVISSLLVFSLFSVCTGGEKIKGDDSEKIKSDGSVSESDGH